MSTKINLSNPEELNAWGERMAALSRQRREERAEAKPSAAPPSDAAHHLPAWPEAVRGMPNGVLRSALFSAAAAPGRTQSCWTA